MRNADNENLAICADKKEEPRITQIGTDYFRNISRGAAKDRYRTGLYRYESLHAGIAIYVKHGENFLKKYKN